MRRLLARRNSGGHGHVPLLESLEGRALLTTSPYANVAALQGDYGSFVGFLQTLELHSKVTSAEYLALRDDVLAITQAASTTSLPLQTANLKAAAASLQIDRSFLLGFLDDSGWNDIKSRFAGNLSGLNVPQQVIDKTITDMRAVAESAGVSAGAYATFNKKFDTLRKAESSFTSTYTSYDDPQLYYTRHLRGFVHGGVTEKRQNGATLNADIRAIASAGGRGALATLKRDVGQLEKIEASLSSVARAQVGDAVIAAFAQGAPDLNQLTISLDTAVGPVRTRATNVAISKFVADAPKFFAATGSSLDSLATIVHDVAAYVTSGGGLPENAFRVQILRTGNRAGS